MKRHGPLPGGAGVVTGLGFGVMASFWSYTLVSELLEMAALGAFYGLTLRPRVHP